MRKAFVSMMMLSCLGLVQAACGGGGPCAKSVEATAKYGSGEEKKMATDMKDQFVKACEMGMEGSPEMKKIVECQAAATDEASFNKCRGM